MLAVLAVNAAGYLVAPWGPILGERIPADSSAATVVQGLIAAVLQGKGLPMLAFLFGMGLVLSARGRDPVGARARATTRQKRLLGLGVVHGVFVYFGDILTMYALIGWHLLSRVREPWRSLRRRLWRALWWALGVSALAALLTYGIVTPGETAGEPGPPTAEPRMVLALNWVDFWIINAGAYGAIQLGSLLLAWPVLRLCMLCGIAAARLRLLTHRRWRPLLQRGVARAALPLLLLNLGYGWAYVSASAGSERALWVESLGSLVGPPLAAVYVIALALAARGGAAPWCQVLAALGQRTLTLYVGHSVLCVLLFGGVGLGLGFTTGGMALFSLTLWGVALALALASRAHRWPLEAWLARR